MSPAMTTVQQIRQARRRIVSRLHRTPLLKNESISRITGLNLAFKMELFQKTGSFKVRGVLNKLSRLTPEQKQRGVISMSSGNHAQALAWAAGQFGIPATIVMPAWSRSGKIEATRGYGGNVVLTEGNLLETCRRMEQEKKLTLIHPFDDPDVIAGHGSLGLEIVEECKSVEAVLVSIGGGGLISGVAAAVKALSPSTRVIGVEPEGAPVISESLKRGHPCTLERIDTIADGLAAPFAGRLTLRHVRQFVDQVVLVSDEEIIAAMKLILERCKVVAEPAAAAALAPLLCRKVQLEPGTETVCVLCGGNVDSATLAKLLSR